VTLEICSEDLIGGEVLRFQRRHNLKTTFW
jgi:hypothetical protein